jgi:hypothetical protein
MTLQQDQIALIHQKIDGLHRMIEELSERITFVLSGEQPVVTVSNRTYSHRVAEPSYQSVSISHSYDAEMVGHKDVIVEPDYIESDRSNAEQPLTSEVQVQRLTAQLTAAYNRIAALEEQLLSHCIH